MSQINVLNHLKEDHAAIDRGVESLKEALFNLRYEGKGSLGKNLKQAKSALHFFNQKLLGHMRLEEKVLFPYLERYLPKLESVICLLKLEHDSLKRIMDEISRLIKHLSTDKVKETARAEIEMLRETGVYWIYLLRSHVEMENGSIYKIMNRELRQGEKLELAKKIRQYQHC